MNIPSTNTLRLVDPPFSSPLMKLIIDLDYLRRKELGGTTHPSVFFQLKHIFHTLESIGSARIEGNNTTIAEYIETKLVSAQSGAGEMPQSHSANIQEILNIEQAMGFIENALGDNPAAQPINRALVSQMHSMIVENLRPPPHGEGDAHSGEYRKHNVSIHQSLHLPPEWLFVEEQMEALFAFINAPHGSQYDLLKIAVAHHRFVWIHPFSNGNGRTVRLLTYAMLVKAGFNVNVGRILNPTAVFCSNRSDYYTYLAQADTGMDEGILAWCGYVLSGLKDEIEKIDKLLNYQFLSDEILLPALNYSLRQKYITETEAKILRIAVTHQIIQVADLKEVFPGKVSQEISRQIKKLISKQMLVPERDNRRKYILRFDNNFLFRGIIHALGKKGFLPLKD
jgi:Fic family protein